MREELLTPDIIRVARSLKRQIVEITPHYICGTDSMGNTFSVIYPNGNIELDPEIYYLGLSSELTKYQNYLMNMYDYQRYKPIMDNKRATCHMTENNKLLLAADDITTGQQYILPGFAESLTRKAKYGSTFVFSDMAEFMMSCCGTIHPINKSDIVNISIFDYDEISFLARFTIVKKKYTIYEYIRFLYP